MVYSKTYELYITNGGSLDAGGSLDTQNVNLLGNDVCPDQLTGTDLENFIQLRAALEALLATEIACEGDGNLDKRVDIQDLVGVMQDLNSPSVFDMNNDGVTNGADLQCVLNNMGNVCTILDPGTMCDGITGACWIAAENTCTIATEVDCSSAGGVNWVAGTIHCCPCTDTENCLCG